MERYNAAPYETSETGKIYRTIPEYGRDILKFNSLMRATISETNLDYPTQKKAEIIIADRFNSSPKGAFYKIALLSLFEPGYPKVESQKKVGAALYYATIGAIDDTIDTPNFPAFPNVTEFNDYLYQQSYLLKKPRHTVSLDHLRNFTLNMFTQDGQNNINSYLGNASQAHWEYASRGKPGDYNYSDALDYRMRTTIATVNTARSLIDLYITDGAPMLVGQILDDAIDTVEDARANSMNLFVGLSKDTGELDILLSEMDKHPKIPDIIKGKLIRRKMPLTTKRYAEIFQQENKWKTSPTARKFNRALSVLI